MYFNRARVILWSHIVPVHARNRLSAVGQLHALVVASTAEIFVMIHLMGKDRNLAARVAVRGPCPAGDLPRAQNLSKDIIGYGRVVAPVRMNLHDTGKRDATAPHD
jgi:hypothetical protein